MSENAPAVDYLREMVERQAHKIVELHPRHAPLVWSAVQQARRERITLLEASPALFSDPADFSLRSAGDKLLGLLARQVPARSHEYDTALAAILDPDQARPLATPVRQATRARLPAQNPATFVKRDIPATRSRMPRRSQRRSYRLTPSWK